MITTSKPPRFRSWLWRFTCNTAAINAWAHAQMERARPPVCDRESCYTGSRTIASRAEHGCIPDFHRN